MNIHNQQEPAVHQGYPKGGGWFHTPIGMMHTRVNSYGSGAYRSPSIHWENSEHLQDLFFVGMTKIVDLETYINNAAILNYEATTTETSN